MITFLSRFFIKDYKDYASPQVRQSYGMLCGAVGIALNIFLFLGKWLAGMLSGSIAITADAFNNLSDAGSSVITLVGFKLSGQKPDTEHPFGHGRMEYISGLLVSVAVLIMGFELIRSSIDKIRTPEPIECSPIIILVLAASILVKIYMYTYNRGIGHKIDSTAMQATAGDSLSDTVATSLVLLATIISQLTGLILDGWFGVLVGIFIFYTGITTMKDTIDPLLGQAPEKNLVEEIEEIVALLLKELQSRCKAQLDIELSFRPSVKECIAKKGFDSKYGARPLKREIQTRIEDSLAEEILSGRAQRGDHVTVTVKDDKITFLVRKYEAKA